jgi:hypothetical protein
MMIIEIGSVMPRSSSNQQECFTFHNQVACLIHVMNLSVRKNQQDRIDILVLIGNRNLLGVLDNWREVSWA